MKYFICLPACQRQPTSENHEHVTYRDGQYLKYMYLKYVFEIQNTILYLNAIEKNKMYFVFKYI